MRKINFLFLLFIALFFSSNVFAQIPGGNTGGRFVNQFAEEFNYTGAPNSSIWFTRNNSGFTRNSSVVEVDGNKLRIKPIYPNSGNAQGAFLRSNTRFEGNQRYGYYEARVRIVGLNNNNSGMIWPSWWMWGNRLPGGQNTTEIDVFEYSGFTAQFKRNRASSSHHYRGIPFQGALSTSAEGTASCMDSRSHTSWQRWGVYWGPNDIIFYYNGTPFMRSNNPGVAASDPGSIPLILSASPHTRFDVANNNKGPADNPICPQCNGEQPNNVAGFAARRGVNLPVFEVDYVRVWRDTNTNAGPPGNIPNSFACNGGGVNGANNVGNNNNNNNNGGGTPGALVSNNDLPNGVYFINNPNANNQTLGIAPNNNVGLRPGGGDDVRWRLSRVGNGIYTIESIASPGRFLEVPFAACISSNTRPAQNPDSNVGTWTNSTQAHQRWQIRRVSNGEFIFVPTHCTGSAIDRFGGSATANAQLFRFNNGQPFPNQRWRIQRTSNFSRVNKTLETTDSITIENNPIVDGSIQLSGSTDSASYSISNISGQTIQSGNISDNSINVSGLSSGLYIIQITNEGDTEVEKIIIQ